MKLSAAQKRVRQGAGAWPDSRGSGSVEEGNSVVALRSTPACGSVEPTSYKRDVGYPPVVVKKERLLGRVRPRVVGGFCFGGRGEGLWSMAVWSEISIPETARDDGAIRNDSKSSYALRPIPCSFI